MKKIKFVIILVAIGLVCNVHTMIFDFSFDMLGATLWNLSCLIGLIGYGSLLKRHEDCLQSKCRLLGENIELKKAISAKDEAIRSYKWEVDSLKKETDAMIEGYSISDHSNKGGNTKKRLHVEAYV